MAISEGSTGQNNLREHNDLVRRAWKATERGWQDAERATARGWQNVERGWEKTEQAWRDSERATEEAWQDAEIFATKLLKYLKCVV